MVDSVVGALIVVVASSALVMAVQVAEQALQSAGRQPLNPAELELLELAGRSDSTSLNTLQPDLDLLPQEASEL